MLLCCFYCCNFLHYGTNKSLSYLFLNISNNNTKSKLVAHLSEDFEAANSCTNAPNPFIYRVKERMINPQRRYLHPLYERLQLVHLAEVRTESRSVRSERRSPQIVCVIETESLFLDLRNSSCQNILSTSSTWRLHWWFPSDHIVSTSGRSRASCRATGDAAEL